MKLLPLDINQPIRTYSHNLYINSIINNNQTCGDLAKIKISDWDSYEWDILKTNSEIAFENEYISIQANPYNKTKTYIYRECKDNDEIICRVDFVQYTNPWDCLHIFINDGTQNMINDTSKTYEFNKYINSDFGLSTLSDSDIKYHSGRDVYPYTMKITHKHGKIKFSILYKGEKWIKIDECKIDNYKSRKLKIGVGICLSENQYYKWLFMNHIQLYYSESCGMLDYYLYPLKYFQRFSINPFLAFFPEKRSTIKSYNWTEWDLVRNAIDNNRYIALHLDEYYVPDRDDYKKYHYFHENLIYGYSEESKTIYLLGVIFGQPKLSTISFRLFCKAYNSKIKEGSAHFSVLNDIIMMEYRPSNTYSFDIRNICSFLDDYINGTNSSNKLSWLTPSDPHASFGVNIFKKITQFHNGNMLIISDVRISYVLHEHTKCMIERIKYFLARGIIDGNQFSEISMGMDELLSITKACMYRIVKNHFKIRNNIDELVINYVNKIEELQIKYYSMLLSYLKSYLDSQK